jgi:hypothetical protein
MSPLAKYIARKIESANDSTQHPFANIFALMERQRKTLRASVDIRVIDHPLGALATLCVKLESCIVLMQDS